MRRTGMTNGYDAERPADVRPARAPPRLCAARSLDWMSLDVLALIACPEPGLVSADEALDVSAQMWPWMSAPMRPWM